MVFDYLYQYMFLLTNNNEAIKNSNIVNNIVPKIISNDSKIIQINTQILENTFDDYDN